MRNFVQRALLAPLAPLALVAALLAVPATASAATWTPTPEACGASRVERGSGQMDAAGNFYMACSKAEGDYAFNHIRISDPSGRVIRMVPTDFGDGYLRLASDVA